MDPEIAAKLYAAFRAALDVPAVQRALADFATFSNYEGPEEYRQLMAEQQQQEKKLFEKKGPSYREGKA